MYLVGVSEEELRPDPKPEKPQTPKAKWENFWYHYKWATVIGLAVIVVLAVLIGQMASRNPSDYMLVLVTNDPVPTPALKRLQAELEVAGRDLDGDGWVEVFVDNLSMNDQMQAIGVGATKLQTHLATADVMLFAFEPELYEQYIEAHESEEFRFFSLLDVEAEGLVADGRLWNWINDQRRKDDPYLSTLPEKLYFGVRDTSGVASKSGQLKEDGMALMVAFITDTPQPKPVETTAP